MSSPDRALDSIATGDAVADARAYYQAELALGVDRFLHRLPNCPWCGSAALKRRTTCRDLRQGKPGSFVLDRCCDCGHIFQNPAVNDEGLEFYYRDAYDGLNAAAIEARFASMTKIYRSRVETVRMHRSDPPRRWLDIGTAHGHFCETAAEEFPRTRFDGLDMSEGVVVGQQKGRVSEAFRGQLLDLRDQLAGKYDQVTMIHYLEHTRDPLAELDAAVDAMSTDGWLMIEQPNPEALSSKIFGSWWAGWNQPEHLNMVTLGNLVGALEDRGLEVVAVTHREAHVPLEAFVMVANAFHLVAPAGDVPWLPPRARRVSKARRLVAKLLLAPLMPIAAFLDWVVLPKLLHSYHAYRVVARKPGAQLGSQ